MDVQDKNNISFSISYTKKKIIVHSSLLYTQAKPANVSRPFSPATYILHTRRKERRTTSSCQKSRNPPGRRAAITYPHIYVFAFVSRPLFDAM